MQLHISPNIDQLSVSVANWMVQYINETLQKQDRFTLVLSGGSTPKKLNALLASDAYKNKIDWSKVHIFFGDERFVPLSDERSNAKLAYDTLLNHVNVLPENIHVMPTENISPEDAAKEYEEILKEYFPKTENSKLKTVNSFDLIFLGMGDDGHTLSLFPGKTAVIHETKKLCTSLWLESQNMHRITLTHPIVNNAAQIAFLATGSGKATVLKEVLKGDYNPDLYPSQIIKPVTGELHWFVDEAAAANL
ncbi:MAG TPA: 6-phosphogluconolactonase [Panacibacter sp.]|nr:6-phosphogluconolactonase [Panacibacter sp.]